MYPFFLQLLKRYVLCINSFSFYDNINLLSIIWKENIRIDIRSFVPLTNWVYSNAAISTTINNYFIK